MISLFILGLLLLLLLWNAYYASHWSRNLAVSLNFVQEYVYAGEQAQMTEQIENRKKLMLPVLEVAFHMDKRLLFHDWENTSVSDFVYKRDIFALLGYQRITRKLTLDCTKRGYYRIDQAYMTSFSMLHRRRFSIECPTDTELYVYAARADVSDILVACERLMGNVQCAKRLYEDPFAFSSIREYTITDPMKTINWKASARTGDLMVNTFESTLTERVMIYLDMEDSGILKHEHLIEESVSVASSLAQRLIVRGMEVGICVNTNIYTDMDVQINGTGVSAENSQITFITPSSGKKQLNNIEQVLAKCKSDGKIVPFATLLSPQFGFVPQLPPPTSSNIPEDDVMIFISKNADRNQNAIENYVEKNMQAIWVVPFTKNDTCSIKTSDNIHLIRREVEIS